MNGIDLIEKIKNEESVKELLQIINGKTSTETQSKRGNLVEKLWDIVIKFGLVEALSNDKYNHFIGNINTCNVKTITNLETYLQKMLVFSKGKGGASDITLQHKQTGEWVFISSKYFLNESKKSIDKYDVEKILAITKQHVHKYQKHKIYLLVNNKQKLLDIMASCQSTNNYIKENIYCILDLNNLEIYFQKLKSEIQHVDSSKFNSIFFNSKKPLQLRFHQDLLTHQIMLRIDKDDKDFLLGAKCRSGKTYCVGGLFVKYYKKYNSLNALIITPAPTETLSQFTDDLFHEFRDFIGINIIEIKKGVDLKSLILKENNLIIVSKQLLDDYVYEKKVESIQQLDLNFIVFDENHFHGTTQMSKNILQSYSSPKTIRFYLTATFSKPLFEYDIPTNCRFYWDIEDEQLCKKRNIQGLVEKHGENVLLFLSEKNKEAKLSVYDNMPDLEIYTSLFLQDKLNIIKEKIKDSSYGFSCKSLLSGDYPKELDQFLGFITGSSKEKDFPKKDLSIFGRIRKTCIKSNSRTKLNNGDFSTQLWFLPYGVNMPIKKVCEHMLERMAKNSILKNYAIEIVISDKKYSLQDIKQQIKNWELKAKEEGKDGLILLAGNQLTLGITLPFVDIVFLLNDITSSDKIFQMMHRCMTESFHNDENDKINKGQKKKGFVVDFNISRVLNTCLDYNVHKKDLNVEQTITYVLENHLMNIDRDLLQSKENKTKLVQKLVQIWKADPINSLKRLLRKIENTIIDLDTNDQQALNHYFTSSIPDDRINLQVKFDEESNEPLPNGIVLVKENLEGYTQFHNKNDECKKEIENISLTKDVLPFILPLSCILTIHTCHKDILEMLKIIKSNPSLLDLFNDQSFVWWNKKDIIELIEKIVEKYIKKNSDVYNITIQFKMSLQSLIDKPKELLELIQSCLKPKQKEKQENGEVFTPMSYIFEMLDNLDKHYINQHGHSIFTEKNFKWLDPSSGMGNFAIAIYLRLMEGLKQQIPNDFERKKHILENMLYMSELNKKNVFVCHQIFNINNEFKLNLYQGDTLELDTFREWGILPGNFDVSSTNPAYNKGGIRSHTGKQLGVKNETIWTKFIEKSFQWLKPDGYLVFINPLSWLKKSHSLHTEMLNKHIVWLKLWDDSKSKGAINADIPISLYILHNSLNTTFKKTEIISDIKRKKLITSSLEYLNPNYSVPLAFHSIFEKLVQFIEQHNCHLEIKTKTIKSCGQKIRLPTEFSLQDLWAIDTFTLKEGILVKKAIEQHPDASKRKLIIANKRGFRGAFIDEGKLSLTGNHKFYILGENLELMKKMMGFKISEIISDYLKYGQSFLDSETFKYFPDIRKLGIVDITEKEFYKLIGLTPEEIKLLVVFT